MRNRSPHGINSNSNQTLIIVKLDVIVEIEIVAIRGIIAAIVKIVVTVGLVLFAVPGDPHRSAASLYFFETGRMIFLKQGI